jgi:hypothetical protein
MNDKLLNFVTIIFFASIIINGLLIMVTMTPAGSWITDRDITNDTLQYNSMSKYSTETTDGFISNTSQSQDASSFNPFTIISNIGNSILAGINAFNFLAQGLFMLELVFFRFSAWFPLFAPIFLSIAGIVLGAKLLLIGYFGSVLLSSILGRR